jgi:tRNA-modifying protein YgfZ
MFSPQSYDSVRHGAALAQRRDRGVIRVAGADAASWLQGLLTNDIETLPTLDPAQGRAGDVRYTAYLTPQGRMITDARVVRLADRILMDVPTSLAASLVTKLDALIFAEDVQVSYVGPPFTGGHAGDAIVVLELHGPRAPALVEPLLASGLGTAGIARDDQFGVPGYAIYAIASDADLLVDTLVDGGAQVLDPETLDVVRIESGRPAFLVDMDTDTIPLEAGIEDRAISFTKGCYVGQEIIVRVTQRGGGRVAKKLVGLDLGANGGAAIVPARGATIRAGDRDLGRVTSAAFSPALGHAIALGYVHRNFIQPGTAVRIVGEGVERDATVTVTPFVPAS